MSTKLHPDFGFAQFNLGVSLMIQRDHLGAVSALERSLKLEPRNTKVMVYLGQASTLSRELHAITTPSLMCYNGSEPQRTVTETKKKRSATPSPPSGCILLFWSDVGDPYTAEYTQTHESTCLNIYFGRRVLTPFSGQCRCTWS